MGLALAGNRAYTCAQVKKARMEDDKMETEKIYKRDNSGNIRVWFAETDDDSSWRTHSGILGGEIVTSEWRYAPAKSQHTDALQAEFEATSARDKKLKLDYKLSVNDIDNNRDSIIKPMLAHTYAGWQGRCFAQPKLDGMRCIANKDGLWSRNNRVIVSAPHILKELYPILEENPNYIFDGELYNHQMHADFNSIMSLAKKTKPTFADFELSAKYLEYHVYDMFDLQLPNISFFNRHLILLKNLSSLKSVKLVDTFPIDEEEELNLNFTEMLEQGYEGQIVRLNKPYEQKRSSNLLKRKEFIDAEFELLDIESGVGNWDGYAKRAVCAMPDGTTFGAGISGTQEFCAALLREKEKYKSVTVTYFALTPDGVPRFPIANKFWDKEFGDLEDRIKNKKDLFI